MARTAVYLRFASYSNFPVAGNSSTLYIATDTNTIYRWDWSAYVEIGGGGGWTPTLQQVTDEWNETTNNIIINRDVDTFWIQIQDLTWNDRVTAWHWQFWDGFIQVYNDDDTIGTSVEWDTVLVWDRVWIQVTTPQAPLHVASVNWTTLNNVVTGSASLVAETLPNIPTGSITQIAEPAAWSGGTASYTPPWGGGTAISGNWDSYDFRISPCLYVSSLGTFYRSQFYETVSAGASPADFLWYDISLSWWTVTISGESVYYFVEYDVNASGSWQPVWLYSTTAELLTNLSGSNSTTAFPTYYNNTPTTPPTAYTGGSATAVNVGSGGISEVGNTILMEVDSVLNIVGTDYVSGSPTSGSFSDSGLGSYDAEMSWTDNGNSSNSIVRISQDSGSTWYYQYTGSSTSPYNFTSLSNDSSAEARWWQTYSGGAINFYFTPHGQGSAPSGSTVYSVAGTQYSISLPADSQNYIFKHTFAGNTLGKTLENQVNSYGQSYVSWEFYDVWYTTWWSGTTVTPQSYWFSGTAQNRDYKIYSSGSGIYAVTPLTVSTTAWSGSKSVSLSWTLPSGITTVKILRQVNGGGYTVSKTVSGSSTTDDTTDTSWSGNTTVTPTSIIWGTARFDKALTTLTDEAQLLIVESSWSGTRYPKMTFWVANNSSSAITPLAHIYSTSATWYLNVATGRLNIESSLGGTATTILWGSGNFFNNAQSSTNHFTVKGSNDASLLNTRSDMDTVWFGKAIGSDQSTTVQIQPARSGDAGLVMIGHASQSGSSTLIRTQTSAGSFTSEITVWWWIRTSTGAVSTPAQSCRSDTNTGRYFPASDTIVDVTGGVERTRIDSSGKFWIGTTPSAMLHVLSTTEQLRSGYNASNYFNATTGSTGITVFDWVGTAPEFQFRDKLGIGATHTNNSLFNVYWVGATYAFVRTMSNVNVAHGMTSDFPTDVYWVDQMCETTKGGYFLTGIVDTGNENAMKLRGVLGSTTPTSAAIRIIGGKKNWTTTQNLADTEKMVTFTKNNGDEVIVIYGNGDTTVKGNLTLGTAGNKIKITEGTNASVGVATLVAWTVTVNTTAVTANSRIFLTRQTTAGTLGASVDVTARTAGTSFTITSNGSVLDTSTVAWMIIN